MPSDPPASTRATGAQRWLARLTLAAIAAAAELRLLPHLATHRSFREIGEGLHLSPHTVKTQAIAIYRKFGVSSRSPTIQRAQDLGLLTR